MAIMTWGAHLELGIAEIDLQHRNLVAIANHLHDAISARQAHETIDWIIDELTMFAKYHFDSEERIMRKHRHANADAHVDEHRSMLRVIRGFRTSFHDGAPNVDRDVMQFLSGWLHDHIMKTDRMLVQHLAVGNH